MGFGLVDSFLEQLASKIGMPLNLINLFTCMLITFPFGLITRYIYNPKLRLMYGLITGLLLQYQMYGKSMLHLVVATTNTYLFIKYLGRKYSAFYVMAFNIIHLSFIHLNNMIYHYGNWYLGVETLYMMSICKFSSVAFTYEDGAKPESEIKSSYHRAKLVKEKPTLLEIFSFIFYFPSSLIGPSFEFSDFMRYIKYEKEYSNINWKACNKGALYHFAAGILNTFILVVFGKKFQTLYCGTEEYANQSLIYKYLFMLASVHVLRSKYYIGWKLSQAAVIFCGLGYDVKTNDKGESVATFDRVENINITKLELDISPLNRIKYWNRTVHLWLKYHLFMRLINVEKRPFKNNKPLASLITFMVSAFWHGFYPVYFVFFLQYYLIDQVSKYLEYNYDLFNKIEKSSIVPRNLFRLFICFVIDYFGLCFSLLSLTSHYYFNKAFYFVPLTSLFCGYLFILYSNIHHKKKRGHGHRGEVSVNENYEKTKGE